MPLPRQFERCRALNAFGTKILDTAAEDSEMNSRAGSESYHNNVQSTSVSFLSMLKSYIWISHYGVPEC
jgi:hypothetical protein